MNPLVLLAFLTTSVSCPVTETMTDGSVPVIESLSPPVPGDPASGLKLPVHSGVFQYVSVGPMGSTGPISDEYAPHVFGSYSVGVRMGSWGMGGMASFGATVKRELDTHSELYLTVGELALFGAVFWDFSRFTVSLIPMAGAAVVQDPYNDITVSGVAVSLGMSLGFRVSPSKTVGLWIRGMHLLDKGLERTIEFWSPRSRTLYEVSASGLYGYFVQFGVSLMWF